MKTYILVSIWAKAGMKLNTEESSMAMSMMPLQSDVLIRGALGAFQPLTGSAPLMTLLV